MKIKNIIIKFNGYINKYYPLINKFQPQKGSSWLGLEQQPGKIGHLELQAQQEISIEDIELYTRYFSFLAILFREDEKALQYYDDISSTLLFT